MGPQNSLYMRGFASMLLQQAMLASYPNQPPRRMGGFFISLVANLHLVLRRHLSALLLELLHYLLVCFIIFVELTTVLRSVCILTEKRMGLLRKLETFRRARRLWLSEICIQLANPWMGRWLKLRFGPGVYRYLKLSLWLLLLDLFIKGRKSVAYFSVFRTMLVARRRRVVLQALRIVHPAALAVQVRVQIHLAALLVVHL